MEQSMPPQSQNNFPPNSFNQSAQNIPNKSINNSNPPLNKFPKEEPVANAEVVTEIPEKKHKWWIWVVAGVVVLLLVAGIYYFYFK